MWETVLKAWLKSRCTSSPALFSFTKLVILLHQGMIRPDFCFINSHWLFPSTFLSLVHLAMAAKIFRSNPFSRTKVRQASLQFPGSSSFLFLDRKVIFAFFQSLGTFPDSWDLSNTSSSGLVVTGQLPQCTHTSVCPILPCLFECSLIWSLFLRVNLPLSRLLRLASGTWNCWKPVLSVITKAKKTLGTSFFSTPPSPGTLHCSAAGTHLPYFCFFLQMYLQKPS